MTLVDLQGLWEHQCTLISEGQEDIKDDQIVEKNLKELKKITQECVMLQMSSGDDVFGMARNLLKLVKKSGELMQKETTRIKLDIFQAIGKADP